MNWYLAKFVYRIICGSGNHLPQFDEQLRLIIARNKEEALNKARQTGEKEQESFYNQKQQLVQWQFIDISELYLLDELIDGAEIYSRIEEKEDAAGYIYTVRKKAGNIRVSQHDRTLQASNAL